jgi:hypothetical protein
VWLAPRWPPTLAEEADAAAEKGRADANPSAALPSGGPGSRSNEEEEEGQEEPSSALAARASVEKAAGDPPLLPPPPRPTASG